MGLLSSGTPMSWLDSRKYNEHVRVNGIEQLLNSFKSAESRDGDELYWGDEVEYMICEFDEANENVVLSVKHDEVLVQLNTEYQAECDELNVHFHPEYGRFMLEATPAKPYKDFEGAEVERNMQMRRAVAEQKLKKFNDVNLVTPLSLAVFPRMGRDNFTNLKNPWDHKNSASRSLFLPDEIINRHARFPTLTANIRTRRGEKVCINVPMYKDVRTPETDPSIHERDWFVPEDLESAKASKPGYIYMDSMGFGMGCSCLQLTFQAPNINKARYLYDTLLNFAPIFLAATAASPVFKGFLADQDVRWNVIVGAVDDRTPYERSVEPLLPKYNNGYGGIATEDYTSTARINKSRYSVVDLYLGGNEFYDSKFNDTEVPINEKVFKRLVDNEKFKLDKDLARHFAHLFIRDPLVIFEERIDQDNETETDHFENIQSTNWQSVRFKVPSQSATPNNKGAPGWRVEFRPMEVQLTDFENAAYSNLIYLLIESILTFDDKINAYMYMSEIWKNMETAHHRDATLKEKFYWKSDFSDLQGKTELLSIDEIFHNHHNGIFAIFINPILARKGLIVKSWTELKDNTGNAELVRLYHYLKLISDRASGKLPSFANFIRTYILNHPEYDQTSSVSQRINYDVLHLSYRITHYDDSKNELSAFLGEELATYLTQNSIL
ncbi:Gsh1 [Kluyveromyces lactis]|nr:Gsh1 [Kluyveromyces lactis]